MHSSIDDGLGEGLSKIALITTAVGGLTGLLWGYLSSLDTCSEEFTGTERIGCANSLTESIKHEGLTNCLSEGGVAGGFLWIVSTLSGGGAVYIIIAKDNSTPYSLTEERASRIHEALHKNKKPKWKLPSLIASTPEGVNCIKRFFGSANPRIIDDKLDIAEQLLSACAKRDDHLHKNKPVS